MARHHLTDTDTSSKKLKLLGPKKAEVVNFWSELQAYIKKELGDEYVEILAEPVRAGRDKISWYTAYEGKGVPLSKLKKKEQKKYIAVVQKKIQKLNRLVEKPEVSGQKKSNGFGEFLYFALCIPGKEQMDNVWIVAGQPVLVNWGARDNLPGVVAKPLNLKGDEVVTEDLALEILPFLLWSVFLVLCFSIWYRMLPACAIGDARIGFCRVIAAELPDTTDESPHENQLEQLARRSDQVQHDISRLPQCSAGYPAYLNDTRPVIDDTSVGQSSLPAESDLRTDSLSAEEARGINTQLMNSNAFACDAELIVTWEDQDVDLDLGLFCEVTGDLRDHPTDKMVTLENPQNCGVTYDIASGPDKPDQLLDRICFDSDLVPGLYKVAVLAETVPETSSAVSYKLIWRQSGVQDSIESGEIDLDLDVAVVSRLDIVLE